MSAVDYEICILAGGLSSRMGQDKARLRLGRWTLLGHVRRAAEQVGKPVRVIRKDIAPGCGPLGGVYTALRRTRREAALFLSCDMPFVSAELIQQVANELDESGRAVFVESENGAGFPFVVRQSALPAIEEMIQKKRFSLQALAQVLHAKPLVLQQAKELFNVNTPADMTEAGRFWANMSRSCSARQSEGKCFSSRSKSSTLGEVSAGC